MSKQSTEVFAFACRTSWAPQWGETIYNAQTAGQAKLSHFYQVRESWPDTKFTDMRSRKVGAPHTSAEFIRNAQYRGMPDLRCGRRVRTNGSEGVIVGHNSSANFDVLFETGKYAGSTLSVHPSEIELIA